MWDDRFGNIKLMIFPQLIFQRLSSCWSTYSPPPSSVSITITPSIFSCFRPGPIIAPTSAQYAIATLSTPPPTTPGCLLPSGELSTAAPAPFGWHFIDAFALLLCGHWEWNGLGYLLLRCRSSAHHCDSCNKRELFAIFSLRKDWFHEECNFSNVQGYRN